MSKVIKMTDSSSEESESDGSDDVMTAVAVEHDEPTSVEHDEPTSVHVGCKEADNEPVNVDGSSSLACCIQLGEQSLPGTSSFKSAATPLFGVSCSYDSTTTTNTINNSGVIPAHITWLQSLAAAGQPTEKERQLLKLKFPLSSCSPDDLVLSRQAQASFVREKDQSGASSPINQQLSSLSLQSPSAPSTSGPKSFSFSKRPKLDVDQQQVVADDDGGRIAEEDLKKGLEKARLLDDKRLGEKRARKEVLDKEREKAEKKRANRLQERHQRREQERVAEEQARAQFKQTAEKLGSASAAAALLGTAAAPAPLFPEDHGDGDGDSAMGDASVAEHRILNVRGPLPPGSTSSSSSSSSSSSAHRGGKKGWGRGGKPPGGGRGNDGAAAAAAAAAASSTPTHTNKNNKNKSRAKSQHQKKRAAQKSGLL